MWIYLLYSMQISYKAVYHLLERYYLRRSLNSLVEENITDDVFKFSQLFALKQEDYTYMEVMVEKREMLNSKYAFFTNLKGGSHPVVLEKDKDFTLLEFAALNLTTGIPQAEFMAVIEAQASNEGHKVVEEISRFEVYVKALSKDSTDLAVEVKKGLDEAKH